MRSAGHVPVNDGAVQVGRPRSPQSPDCTGGAVAERRGKWTLGG